MSEEGREELAKRGNESPASVLVCECGGTIVSAQSGSGSVKTKCQKCKKAGSVKAYGIADLPVRTAALSKASQIAVFPGLPGERSGKGGKRDSEPVIARTFNLNGEGAEIVDAALDAWKKKTQVSGKTWKASALVNFSASFLSTLTAEEIKRFGVEDSVVTKVKGICEVQKLRDSQLTLVPDADDSDNDTSTEDLAADKIEDKAEQMNTICQRAMFIASTKRPDDVLPDKRVTSDDLMAVCSNGGTNGNALRALERGGYLEKKIQVASQRDEARGRKIWVYVPTGKKY